MIISCLLIDAEDGVVLFEIGVVVAGVVITGGLAVLGREILVGE